MGKRRKSTNRRGAKTQARPKLRPTHRSEESDRSTRVARKQEPLVHDNPPHVLSTVSEDTSSDEEPTDYQLLLSSLQPLKKRQRLNKEDESKEERPAHDVDDDISDEDDVESDDGGGHSESEEESEEEPDDCKTGEGAANIINDPFSVHCERDLEEDEVEELERVFSKPLDYTHTQTLHPVHHIVSQATCLPSCNTVLCDCEHNSMEQLHVKQRLASLWCSAQVEEKGSSKKSFSPLQEHLFSIMNSYKDLLFSRRSFDNGEQIRRLYVLHALNHVLKTRSRVLKNNGRLALAAKDGKEIGELRDQGLTRPKVLILVPFREAAVRTVNTIIKLLLPQGTGQVSHRKRFMEEFGEGEGMTAPAKRNKSASFEAMFAGNIDDCFRVGVAVKRNIVRLYSEFYSSDIIIASPLGLRTIVGAEGDKERDFDFLSSLEMVIVDQADVYLMQNWDHLLHLFEHLHLQPKQSHGVDFSRLRMWSINGWSKYYRQTLIFSSFPTPEINSLFNTHCFNYAGKVKVCEASYEGSISQVAVHVPQTFHKIHCQSHIELPDARFTYFVENVLPEFSSELMKQTAVFIPSYFDFVRVRNYMTREGIDFAQMCEYTKTSDVSRARTKFFHGEVRFLLYTERLHFFRRYHIRGIQHIIFYSLPLYMEFYPELINMMKGVGQVGGASTCTILYSRYDSLLLSRTVGSNRANRMISSGDNIQTLVTGVQKQS